MRLPVLKSHLLKVHTVAVSVKYYALNTGPRVRSGLFISLCFGGTLHLEFIISTGHQVPGTPTYSSVCCCGR